MKKKDSAFTDVESIIKRNKLTIKKANKMKEKRKFNFGLPSFKVKNLFNDSFKRLNLALSIIILVHMYSTRLYGFSISMLALIWIYLPYASYTLEENVENDKRYYHNIFHMAFSGCICTICLITLASLFLGF
jgi:hypothetical protein